LCIIFRTIFYSSYFQSRENYLQQTFNLTDEEKFLLLESGVGEGIFFAGTKHVAIKIIASQTEDAIITSNPEQLMALEEQKNAFKNN
jgi:hypothetical protein